MKMYEIKQLLTEQLAEKQIVLNDPFKRQIPEGQNYTLFVGDMIESYIHISLGDRTQATLSLDIVVVGTDEEQNNTVLNQVLTVMKSQELKVLMVNQGINISSITHESTERVLSDDSTEVYESKRAVFKLVYIAVQQIEETVPEEESVPDESEPASEGGETASDETASTEQE